MATELARIGPGSMAELQTFAVAVAQSKFYGFADASQAFVAISAGMDLGLSHAQSARAWHIINGKPTLTADAMRAVCLASQVCEYFEVRAKSDDGCTVATKRRGATAERVVTWTMADAKRAGLGGGNWAKYPRAMLQARATAELAREVYPDLLLGIYTPDELETVEATPTAQPRTVTRDPEPVVAEVVEPTKPGHHATWERDRARFCATVGELGLRYEDVADYCAIALGKPRPSGVPKSDRDSLLDWLRGKGAAKVSAWVAERAVAEVVAPEREPGQDA